MLNKFLGIVGNASEHGLSVDHMLEVCHWFMLILAVGWSSYLAIALFRFRRVKNPKADYHGVTGNASSHAEFAVVLIEAALLLGFALPLWGKRVVDIPEQGEALRVRAVGEQYAWNYHYTGPDGVFGKQNAAFVSSSNPLGLDPSDEAGKDDVVSKNELFAVNQKPIVLEITSKDVIHAVSIKHMRIAQDAIPGTKVPMWFRPIKAGKYEIVCAQLCGAGHYAMRSHLIVDSQEKFDEQIKELSAMQHPAVAASPAQ
jgi:cytochrome c oxidase subunit 2